MRQLGELNKNAAKFKKAGVEVIVVFREEAQGEQGLKLIKKRTKVKFTLALDNGNKKTPRYSPTKGEFDNYVIDRNGVIRAIFDGDLRNRSKSAQLLEVIERLNSGD